jgi:hypothetical protein
LCLQITDNCGMAVPVPHRNQRIGELRPRARHRGALPQWRTRLEGRERVSEHLAALAESPDVTVMCRRRMPLGRGSIDVLAVGPGGVTVVNVLLLRGRLTVVPGSLGRPWRLLVGGHDHTSVVNELEDRLGAVRRELSAGARPAAPVRGGLLVPGDWELAPFASLQLGDVTIDGPETIAQLIGRDGELTPAQVARAADRLRRAFPSAGPRRYAG